MATYDRYRKFRNGNEVKKVPFIAIPKKGTDYYHTYEAGRTRLDLLSYQYYGNANYDWLIMQANPEYGSLEFCIPNGALLRIPFPLDSTIQKYNDDIDLYIKLYGLD